MDHHTIVNTVRMPKRKKRARQNSSLGKRTLDYLAKFKRPFLELKGRISETKIFHIKLNSRSPRTTGKKAGVEVSVVDLESLENGTASKVNTPIPSLDPNRSSLPTELRLKIWRMCWEPRTVEVHHCVNDKAAEEVMPFSSTTFRSAARLPVTLHICKESRSETLRHYSLAFAARNKPPEIYFNFNLDRLYVREADMYRGPAFCATFPPLDLMRLKHLAIPDRYIQHLIGERQRRPSLQLDSRPLSSLLLESRTSYSLSIPNLWQSLEELDIVIDDDKRQRHDRINSWVKEGVYVCAHCVLAELQTSFNAWPDSPPVTPRARTTRGKRLEFNPGPPEHKPIIQREGYVIFMPCCRLRPDELLETLRELDNPPDKPKWATFSRVFGIHDQNLPESMPCRCRLENYLLSEGLTSYSTRWAFKGKNGGELGRLCKKWLQYIPFNEAI